MVQVALKPLTFAEFLAWDDGTGRDFELIDGFPMPLNDPNANHEDVAARLSAYIENLCITLDLSYVCRLSKQIRLKTEPGQRERSRRGDIVIFDRLEWLRLKSSPSSAAAYSPPPMVIEIVSNNWRDDYLTKLAEYENLGIQELWLVDYAAFGATRYTGDPKLPTLSIYTLVEGEYQVQQFRDNELVRSATFPDLDLTAAQIFMMAK
jgi:Uma2 family endonuclease